MAVMPASAPIDPAAANFHPAGGDRLYVQYWEPDTPEAPGATLESAAVFSALDTNLDGGLGVGDATVTFDGVSLDIGFGGPTVADGEDHLVLAGFDHLSADWLV
jgi:hypothetical protein